MARTVTAALLVLMGGLLGALGATAWTTAQRPAPSDLSRAIAHRPVVESESWPPAARSRARPIDPEGRRIFRDQAELASVDLVAMVDSTKSTTGGLIFYAQPLPYGEVLCRVRSYDFDLAVGSTNEDDRWANDLEVSDVYGVWRADAAAAGVDRDAACKAFRDFDHLIIGDGGEVDHVVGLLGQMIQEARAGKPSFKVACQDGRRPAKPIPCDGVEVLRSLSVRDILAVKERIGPAYDPEKYVEPGDLYKHEVSIRLPENQDSCGRAEYLRLVLVSQGEGEILPRSIKISRGFLC